MTYVKIGEMLFPATISGTTFDKSWNGRGSKAITLEMTYEEARAAFVDGLEWAIVYQADSYTDKDGSLITPEAETYDNSDYSVAGPVTDNRDGTVTVKMGVITDGEALAELMEVLA